MRAGDLNKYIALQYPTEVPDGMGGFMATWATAATVWAAIEPTSAFENVRSMQPSMTITHTITIRYRSVIRPNWRIKFGDRCFKMISIINPSTANGQLDITCQEVVA